MPMTNMIAYIAFTASATVVTCVAMWMIVQLTKINYLKEKNKGVKHVQ